MPGESWCRLADCSFRTAGRNPQQRQNRRRRVSAHPGLRSRLKAELPTWQAAFGVPASAGLGTQQRPEPKRPAQQGGPAAHGGYFCAPELGTGGKGGGVKAAGLEAGTRAGGFTVAGLGADGTTRAGETVGGGGCG